MERLQTHFGGFWPIKRCRFCYKCLSIYLSGILFIVYKHKQWHLTLNPLRVNHRLTVEHCKLTTFENLF